jgi:hypothetical protein
MFCSLVRWRGLPVVAGAGPGAARVATAVVGVCVDTLFPGAVYSGTLEATGPSD